MYVISLCTHKECGTYNKDSFKFGSLYKCEKRMCGSIQLLFTREICDIIVNFPSGKDSVLMHWSKTSLWPCGTGLGSNT